MKNLRKYGQAPFDVAVIHGGPGAGGEMAPVARELAFGRGVLEPIQTALSLDGQIDELRTVLEKDGDPPVTLIGFSWGAWLGFICAAKHPLLVKKLILVGSGSFEDKYAVGIQETRLNRLSEAERAEVVSLNEIINNPATKDKNTAFARFGALFSKADAYNPITYESDESTALDFRADIFHSVWPDGAILRSSGKLLEFGRHIECPVIAIHGDYDPHPADGVRKPLSAILKDFRFILLENCGHKPWIEREARDKFYKILEVELR